MSGWPCRNKIGDEPVVSMAFLSPSKVTATDPCTPGEFCLAIFPSSFPVMNHRKGLQTAGSPDPISGSYSWKLNLFGPPRARRCQLPHGFSRSLFSLSRNISSFFLVRRSVCPHVLVKPPTRSSVGNRDFCLFLATSSVSYFTEPSHFLRWATFCNAPFLFQLRIPFCFLCLSPDAFISLIN